MPIPPEWYEKSNITLPYWVDSRYILVLSSYAFTPVTVAGNALVQVVPANPNRWALGFSFGGAIPVGATIGPHNKLSFAPFLLPAQGKTDFFTIFTHGPLASIEWYGLNCATLGMIYHELNIDLPGTTDR